VGRIFFRETNGAQGSRYFTVAAGVGADALLMSRMDAERKRRFGYVLYVVEGFIVWATHPFPLFDASFKINGNFNPRVEQVSQLLAVRIRSFGGVLGEFAPGASLRKNTLSLMAFKTRSRLKYLSFLLAALAGRHTFSGPIELVEADAVDCKSSNGSSAHVYVEADGEVLGALPARIEVASESLTLLIPRNAQP
jgi:diacylglycerol kinase family enzyme